MHTPKRGVFLTLSTLDDYRRNIAAAEAIEQAWEELKDHPMAHTIAGASNVLNALGIAMHAGHPDVIDLSTFAAMDREWNECDLKGAILVMGLGARGHGQTWIDVLESVPRLMHVIAKMKLKE